MITISIIFGIGGILSEFYHIQDWWQPLIITNTPIGIEDFLIGFFIGGIAAVIYEEIYKKKIRIRKQNKSPNLKKMQIFIWKYFMSGY